MYGTYTTEDGYTLTAFGSMYLDYGLRVDKGDENVFYNPHFLSCESYGFHLNDDDTEGDEWTEADWADALRDLAGDVIMEINAEW